VATISAVYEETIDNYATWSHVFQGANGGWLFFDTRQIFGNFYIGLQGQTENAWNTQIPPGSTILSATMEFTGFQNGAGFFGSLYRTTMSSPNRALQTQPQDPIQRPFEVFEGRRRDQWTNADVVVLSTTFTTIAAPATGAANQSVALRGMIPFTGTLPNNTRLEQRITAAAGNTDIASITWRLLRSAVAPVGDVRLRIQGVIVDRGVTVADGVDIAVSNPVVMSSITTAAAGLGVPFTFPGSVSLVAGQQYFLVLDPDPYAAAPFPFSTTSFIVSRNYNAFLTDGQLYHYGEGLGFDWQNYPGVVDLNQAVAAATDDIIPGGIQWPVGTVVINQLETSPDISALIQAQVDMPNYTADSGIIITLSRGSASALGRVMCSNYHATNPGPVLRITYEEPVPVVPRVNAGDSSKRGLNMPDKHTLQIQQEDEDVVAILLASAAHL